MENVGCWRRRVLLLAIPLLLTPVHLQAQTVGSILGRVVDAQTGQPLEAASIEVVGTQLRSVSGADGRFIVGSVPPGERAVRIEHLGYKPKVVEGIVVRTGRSQEVRVELEVSPVALQGVVVEAERTRLVEPDVSTTHDIIVSRELRALPVDRLQQVIELTPGVSGGHFRGGRVGQEVHVVDGVELKNQFEAAREGVGLELSPSSLEEVEVITGGFGAQYGSALSGVVSYVTRRGSTERWEGRASVLTDEWAPASAFRGFNSLSLSAGGPLRFLGSSTTLFADVLAQGMLDAEPRARGLTCLTEEDAVPDLAAEIRTLRENAPALLCPYAHDMLPHQRGDKFIAFARLDRSLSRGLHFNATVLRNRHQRELYTSEFRYSNGGQLGQRTVGTMGTLNLDWSRNTVERALHVAARVSAMRLDRYVGAVDPATFDGPRIGGFNVSGFDFHGESFARSPIEQQIAAPAPLPGYAAPTGSAGTPYGLAATGIFFTGGTPHLASWAKTDVVSTDLVGEVIGVTGSSLRSGLSSKLYRIESYERTLSHLSGSAPNYARFFPAVISGFSEGRIGISDEMTINAGVRVDGFRSGMQFRADRNDFLSPVIDASWNISVNPRFGVAMPIPGTDGGAALRFNYGYVAQPPDFRYFLDTAVGDSLRTDIRRQGNPALSFERGKSYEVGVSRLIGTNAGVGITIFRKELVELVTGSMRIGETGDLLYSTDDEGRVQGAELSMRGRWSSFALRASYALQKATGVASGTESDSLISTDGQAVEYPLAFDRRHSIDVAAFYGRAAGASSPWSVALVSTVQSGYPVDRIAAGDATATQTYLPWTSNVDLRLTRELGRLPGCGTCAWRVSFDGRNLLGVENVIAVRRDTGGRGPTLAAVRALADAMPAPEAIPMESPSYTRTLDVNGDGIITASEFRMARMAAALDRFDPSLFFGEPRQLRLGLEIAF